MSSFGDRLMNAVRDKRTPVMVGIDPRWQQLPNKPSATDPASIAAAYESFSRAIVDLVADLVGVVKFQAAFFEAAGPRGLVALDRAMRRAAEKGLVVVLDAKRGDIGSTAEAYADAYLPANAESPWRADALTVNPFLGRDTLVPFVDRAIERGSGIFVLVRTSNPGSDDLQKVETGSGSISDRIADWVEAWSAGSKGALGYGAIGAVVGATHPSEIAGFRRRMPHVPLLLPGYGAQGGTGADIAGAFDERGLGAVVNNSRGIIFAHQSERFRSLDWKDAVRAATEAMIADLADSTPAGNLRS